MTRYAAFLRGVSPANAKMPQLKACFERAGFTEVKTVLSSGNVIFSARAAPLASIERKAEAAMKAELGHAFLTIVRPVQSLRALVASDPYRRWRVAAGAKRVVTFLRKGPVRDLPFPIELDGARILGKALAEVFTAYVPGPRGPVFMTLIEKTFGKELTTRTWETVKKIAASVPLRDAGP